MQTFFQIQGFHRLIFSASFTIEKGAFFFKKAPFLGFLSIYDACNRQSEAMQSFSG